METLKIAIRGLSASGKGAVAEAIAERIEATHVDCGIIFRAIAFYCQEYGIEIIHDDIVVELLPGRIVVNGITYTEIELRTEDIGMLTSTFTSQHGNDKKLIAIANAVIKKETRAVFDGRNAGLEICPEKTHSFFLEASFKIRVERRFRQLLANGEETTYEEVAHGLQARDASDKVRDSRLVKPVKGEVVINTEKMTLNEVVDMIVTMLKKDS